MNHTFSTTTSMDLASLYTRETPLDAYQVSYNGILSNQLFVEGRFSVRKFSFIGAGATTTDLIDGTLLLDGARGLRYWSPTLCGVCGQEDRDNDNEYVKATYFKSTKSGGTHTLVFGFDSFNDKRFANDHQSGSDYRILGTTSIVRTGDANCSVSPGCIFPQFLPGTLLQFNPIATSSLGTNFRTNALFVNDQLRWSSNLTFNLGLRWDKNNGEDSAGNLVARDSKLSPRLGVVWDPTGDGVWVVSGSYGVYTSALSNAIADSASAAGQPGTIQWNYTGPPINPDLTAPTSTLVAPPAAIQQVFNWCSRDARGFCTGSSAHIFPSARSLRADWRQSGLAKCQRLRVRCQPPDWQPRCPAGGLFVSRLSRLLLETNRPDDGHGPRRVWESLGSRDCRKHRRSESDGTPA